MYYCAAVQENNIPSYLNPLLIKENQALRALHFKFRCYSVNEMYREFQISKVNGVVDNKIQKLIHSLLSGTPKLCSSFDKLIVSMISIQTQNKRNKYQDIVRKKIEQSGKRKTPAINYLEQLCYLTQKARKYWIPSGYPKSCINSQKRSENYNSSANNHKTTIATKNIKEPPKLTVCRNSRVPSTLNFAPNMI